MALEQNFGSNTSSTPHPITIVGCGPGALDYLTPAAQYAVQSASILVGAARLQDMFPAIAAERIVVGADIAQVLDQLASHVGQRKVVVLVSGDPGVCSLAQPVVQRFGWRACRVIPGVSSVQVAFARLGLDWTDAQVISAHHREPELNAASLVSKQKVAVLAGNPSTMPWIVELAKFLEKTHTIFVCENLTLPQEQLTRISAAELEAGNFPSQSILLFIGKKIRE